MAVDLNAGMRVLYLSPLVPAISGSGGKRAVYNHLNALSNNSALDVDVVAIDEEAKGERWPVELVLFSARVFPRGLPRVGTGVVGVAGALRQILLDPAPRAAAVLKSQPAIECIKEMLGRVAYDLVIVDLLKAYALIDKLQINAPIVYLAHNVEAEIYRDRWRHTPLLSLGKWFSGLEYFKTLRYERRLLNRAVSVIAISSGDIGVGSFKEIVKKLSCWPELPTPQLRQWSLPARKTLLFVGSAQYFPNRDAIEWLANELMPRIAEIDSEIRLKVVGTRKDEVALAVGGSNVEFLGFVSHEELVSLHYDADLFISPVVLGSGIKIKVLEASAFGMPIAATIESLRGVDYLDGAAHVIDRQAADGTATSIVNLVNAQQSLNDMHHATVEGLKRAIERRDSLASLLLKAIPATSTHKIKLAVDR